MTIVLTSGGLVAGRRDGRVCAYLGIPYAAPPLGDRRWRPPLVASPWRGLLECGAFRPGAVQTRRPDSAFDVPDQSEDCLSLNVWSPATSGQGPLPVIVWIHGGGFEWGGPALAVYHGDLLAARGTVVVSLAYRLGPFGTFAHPEQRSPANFAMLDLIAALEWVRDNVAAFGGDPSRITIAGQSAGASLVIALMAAPRARTLFHAAIALSPTGLQGFRTVDGSFDKVGARMSRAVTGAEGLSALRQAPAEEVIASSDTIKGASGFFLWQPVVDGDVLPVAPADAFASGAQSGVPLLIGDTDWEGSDFQAFDTAELAGELLQIPAGDFALLREGYRAPSNCVTTGDVVAKCLFSASVQFLADAHARTGANVWRYRLGHRLAGMGRDRGCGHGDDLPLVSGHFGVNGYPAALPVDRKMSDRFQEHIVAFASGLAIGAQWSCHVEGSGTVRLMEGGDEGLASLTGENLKALAEKLREISKAGADKLSARQNAGAPPTIP